jgi:hypothetical protein
MAKLYIGEYEGLEKNGLPAAVAPAVTKQTVAISGSAAASAAFNAITTLIRVHTDVVCSISIGPSAVATTNDTRMAADQTEYFSVQPGHVISVISNT